MRYALYLVIVRALSFLASLSLRARVYKLPKPDTKHRIGLWAHASSAGECEALIPLVTDYLVENSSEQIIFTVFSESGLKTLSKWLNAQSQDLQSKVLYSGLSPLEGYWGKAFSDYRPRVFLTSRYESWPELWAELKRQDIKLYIIGAQDRSSLRWVLRILHLLGLALPEIHFRVFSHESEVGLRRLFQNQKANITLTQMPDPRWKRVLLRSKYDFEGGKWIPNLSQYPRPWFVFGSVYRKDFENLFSHNTAGRIRWPDSGTYFIFPHQIEDDDYVGILRDHPNPKPWRKVTLLPSSGDVKTYQVQSESNSHNTDDAGTGATAVLVGKRGFLTEFYREADFVYVGGGFSKGIHSVIEPGIYEVPLFCGTHRAQLFEEVSWLKSRSSIHLLEPLGEASGVNITGVEALNQALNQVSQANEAELARVRGKYRNLFKKDFEEILASPLRFLDVSGRIL